MQQGEIACGRGTLESSPTAQKTRLALALTIPAFQEGQPYMRLNYGGLFCLIYDLFCVKSNRPVLQSWASSSVKLSNGLAWQVLRRVCDLLRVLLPSLPAVINSRTVQFKREGLGKVG